MLITRVLGDCPACKGADTFGNVSVQRDHVLRGCKTCDYETVALLPEIRKQVLYLDQFFFSHAFRGNDERFLAAIERVKQVSHLQLLVAPYSSVHEDETHQWRGYKDKTHTQLMDFIKLTARGVEFERSYNIESPQILKAFTAYLKGDPAEYEVEDADAIRGALDAWDDYFFVDVGGYWHDVETKRQLKTQAVDELVTTFDAWQQSTQTFDEDVALEYHDAGRLYLQYYIDKLNRIRQGDTGAATNSPIMASMVGYMRDYLPKDMPELEQLQCCAEFFKSGHFAEVPHQWISARIFATLKSMVRRGAYANRTEARKRLSGLFGDITHISLYAPYCDAFVMDTPMAELVRQPTVGLESRYGVQVFSLNNWDAFLAWLDALEARMSNEHKAGVEAAYPTRT
ncbi:MAG: hypothetical protein WC617_13710 [Rhodanobacter sp.]|jgi:hypothetical protein